MSYCVLVLSRYDEASLEYKAYRQKDGALLAIGALCDKLKQTEPYKSELEHMLVQHVFPEFSSPVGHLRAKVCGCICLNLLCTWIGLVLSFPIYGLIPAESKYCIRNIIFFWTSNVEFKYSLNLQGIIKHNLLLVHFFGNGILSWIMHLLHYM